MLRHLPRFRKARAALNQLAQRESWSRSDIEQFQLEKLNLLWKHAITHVPYYRELAAREHLPPRFDSLSQFSEQIPVLSRQTVQSGTDRFLSENAPAGKWKVSGGSTGLPTSFYWSHADHQQVLHAKYRLQQMWDVDFLDRFVFLWGHTASFAHGWKGRLARWIQPVKDWLRNRVRLSAYQLGSSDLQRHLHRIAQCRPTALYGYSTAMLLLAQEALRSRFTPDSLKAVFLTAEPTHAMICDTVQEAFHVPTVIEYGAAECELIAGQWRDGSLRVREDIVLLETVPRSDGRYDILLTVLANPSFPLIRYALGDVTDAPLRRPSQGFAILDSVLGRSNDCLQSRTGRLIHPTWLMSIVSQTSGVRRYQIRQKESGAVEVQIESDHAVSEAKLQHIVTSIREAVEGYPVRGTIIPHIQGTRAGKHRWVISELASLTKQSLICERNAQNNSTSHFSHSGS